MIPAFDLLLYHHSTAGDPRIEEAIRPFGP
jgi:hypothetical protein